VIFDLNQSQSQSQNNFSQFDFDFDFSCMSDFEATKTQFKPELIDLFKKYSQL